MIEPLIKKTFEFQAWYRTLTDTQRTRIDARVDRLSLGHFGASRPLGDAMFELKWKNGLRVYYSRRRVGNVDLIVLWGGFKGSQAADISKARSIQHRYENALENREEGRA